MRRHGSVAFLAQVDSHLLATVQHAQRRCRRVSGDGWRCPGAIRQLLPVAVLPARLFLRSLRRYGSLECGHATATARLLLRCTTVSSTGPTASSGRPSILVTWYPSSGSLGTATWLRGCGRAPTGAMRRPTLTLSWRPTSRWHWMRCVASAVFANRAMYLMARAPARLPSPSFRRTTGAHSVSVQARLRRQQEHRHLRFRFESTAARRLVLSTGLAHGDGVAP